MKIIFVRIFYTTLIMRTLVITNDITRSLLIIVLFYVKEMWHFGLYNLMISIFALYASIRYNIVKFDFNFKIVYKDLYK
jgi:hypothetical protein